MQPNERYKVWLEQAEYDLQAANNSLENRFYEWACYQYAQCVEKALKGVVVHSGARPPQTHKLGALLGICNRANRKFESVKFNFRKIESYTFISRYPFVFPDTNKAPHDMIKREDAVVCQTTATELLEKVKNFLGNQQSMSTDTGVDLENLYFTQTQIESRINGIISSLQEDDTIKVKKIILFGSFAREKTRPVTSTMDLLVIGETELGFIDRIDYVRNLTKGGEPIVEPLIYTPSEFDFMIKEQGEGFLESAIEEGKVIFDRTNL